LIHYYVNPPISSRIFILKTIFNIQQNTTDRQTPPGLSTPKACYHPAYIR